MPSELELELEASGVLEEAALDQAPHEPVDEASTGVEVDEHEVEVLVQTGTEMVHGQSVTVRVVEAETVYVLPAWTILVADGT